VPCATQPTPDSAADGPPQRKVRHSNVALRLRRPLTRSNQPKHAHAQRKRLMDIPVAKIRRPLAATRANDQEKVAWLMKSIAEIGLQEPIDILEARCPLCFIWPRIQSACIPA
jgi:hypothetical protein